MKDSGVSAEGHELLGVWTPSALKTFALWAKRWVAAIRARIDDVPLSVLNIGFVLCANYSQVINARSSVNIAESKLGVGMFELKPVRNLFHDALASSRSHVRDVRYFANIAYCF